MPVVRVLAVHIVVQGELLLAVAALHCAVADEIAGGVARVEQDLLVGIVVMFVPAVGVGR